MDRGVCRLLIFAYEFAISLTSRQYLWTVESRRDLLACKTSPICVEVDDSAEFQQLKITLEIRYEKTITKSKTYFEFVIECERMRKGISAFVFFCPSAAYLERDSIEHFILFRIHCLCYCLSFSLFCSCPFPHANE